MPSSNDANDYIKILQLAYTVEKCSLLNAYMVEFQNLNIYEMIFNSLLSYSKRTPPTQ